MVGSLKPPRFVFFITPSEKRPCRHVGWLGAPQNLIFSTRITQKISGAESAQFSMDSLLEGYTNDWAEASPLPSSSSNPTPAMPMVLDFDMTPPRKRTTSQPAPPPVSSMALFGGGGGGNSSSSSSSSSHALMLTPDAIMQMFSGAAYAVQTMGNKMTQVQETVTHMSTKVNHVEGDVKQLRQELRQLQESSHSQNQQIISNTDLVTASLRSKIWLRRLVFFLFKHGFTTAHGQAIAYPVNLSYGSPGEAPNYAVAVHLPLMTWLFRALYPEMATTKDKDFTTTNFRSQLTNLFEGSVSEVSLKVYHRLNQLPPVKVKEGTFEDKKKRDRFLNHRLAWVVFSVKRFTEVLIKLRDVLDADPEMGLPLKAAHDLSPLTRSAVPSAASIAHGPATRMAFQVPAWEEVLDAPAWLAFSAAMRPVLQRWFPDREVPEVKTVALLDYFCAPVLDTEIVNFAAAQVLYREQVAAAAKYAAERATTTAAKKRKAAGDGDPQPDKKRRRRGGAAGKKPKEPEHSEEEEADTPAKPRSPTESSEASEVDDDALDRVLAADDDEALPFHVKTPINDAPAQE